jgi:hypothetical protein
MTHEDSKTRLEYQDGEQSVQDGRSDQQYNQSTTPLRPRVTSRPFQDLICGASLNSTRKRSSLYLLREFFPGGKLMKRFSRIESIDCQGFR